MMKLLTIEQKYDLFKYAIYESSSKIMGNDDVHILSILYEDLAIDMYCYCCDTNINELLYEQFISEEIADKCRELRSIFRNIEHNSIKRDITEVKTSQNWVEFRAKADLLLI